MAPQNRTGPAASHLTVPEPIGADELVARLADGEWVVDLRNRVAFAADHLAGALSFEYGTGSSFTTYLGWLMPYDARVTLVGSEREIERAIRDLSRIGIDRVEVADGEDPAGAALGASTRSYPRVDWPAIAGTRTGKDVVLDVRRADEFATGQFEGAVNVPVPELLRRLDEVPLGRILVYCASGYRAGIASSILDRSGRVVVQVDSAYSEAAAAGLAVSA